jgi:hypothetical protein
MATPHWREWELDGKLLRFDRETGINQLLEGAQTTALRQRAPRFLHIANTNACNKTCPFCYRPDAPSTWTATGLLDLARWAAEWGVLELTFGGGEPLLFEGFDELLRAIWEQTPLCPSFTTNGLLLTGAFLRRIAGRYGQLQLSVYDDDDAASLERIGLLTREEARFGLNVLATPRRLRSLELDALRWVERGARDVLLLSYKGDDPSLHLSPAQCQLLVQSVNRLRRRFGAAVTFKVDVCWRQRLAGLPQLLDQPDCGAGDAFVSISSDRRVQACSFHHLSAPFTELSQLETHYRDLRQRRAPAARRGCGRPTTSARGECG